MGVFFPNYGQVSVVPVINSKGGITTGIFVMMVIMTQKNFLDVSNMLTCDGCSIYIIVEGCHLHCLSCGAAGHLSKACPRKNLAPTPTPKEMEEAKKERNKVCNLLLPNKVCH